MTMNDLHKYMDPPPWARRQGVHSPPYRRRRNYMDSSLRSSPERLTLADALRDPAVNAAVDRNHARDNARAADSANDLAPSAEENNSYYGEDFGFGRTDPEAHCDIPTITSSSDDAPDMLINSEGEHVPITLLSDEDAGPEESSSQEVLDFRLQRLRLMRRRYELENWDRDDRWSGLRGLHFDANDREPREPRERDGGQSLSRLDALMARSRVYDSPGARDSPAPAPAPAAAGGQPTSSSSYPYPYPLPHATSAYHPTPNAIISSDHGAAHGIDPRGGSGGVELDASKDPLVTCARFGIKRGKHKVALKFEPAISGRFILLKLWSWGGNVDVQSVVAKGFGGQRFFLDKVFV